MLSRIHAVICALLLVFTSVTSADIKPQDGSTINYTHVLFEWDQVQDAFAYHLQVAENDGADPFTTGLIVDHVDSSLLHIVTAGLEWDKDYIWRIYPITVAGENDSGGEEYQFSTAALPATYLPLYVDTYDSLRYQSGITGFDFNREGLITFVDHDGQTVWFAAQDRSIIKPHQINELLPNGNILALTAGSAWELDLDNNVVWEPPMSHDTKVHHATLSMPNGNIMGITRYLRSLPVPPGPWTADWTAAGLNSVDWLVDVIIEWDRNGNEVWRWDVYDHFDTADFDSTIMSDLSPSPDAEFHWAHANAIEYNSDDNAVYFSSRHLNRITKIDYETGNVIWNMGEEKPSGDVVFGHDLDFNFQHAVERLDNGDLIIFDNGNHKEPPLSRGIRIAITGTDLNPSANIIWEYILPDSLYTANRGDCDVLDNGNVLITSANPQADGLTGHVLELDPLAENEIVWQMRIGEGRGSSLMGAERYPGLYPQAFCVVMPNPVVVAPAGGFSLDYVLYNEGWMDEEFDYVLSDQDGWISGTGTIHVVAGGRANLIFNGTALEQSTPNEIVLAVTPKAPNSVPKFAKLIAANEVLSVDGVTHLPNKFKLHQNFPNPFNPATSIKFDLPSEQTVKMVIFDVMGREIVQLVDEIRARGSHEIHWDGRNAAGQQIASGIYFGYLITPEFSHTVKMLMLK